MRRTNLAFGLISLTIGAAMIALVLNQRGLAPSVGLVFGFLLLLNGTLRLWAARGESKS